MKLGVVVLAYGNGAPSSELVTQLAAEGLTGDAVVLVHNGATVNGCRHAGVHTIHPSHNLGYSGGMNVGIKHLLANDASHVLVLTHDVRLGADTISRLQTAAAGAPPFGILAPEVFHPSGKPFSFGGVIEPGGRVRHLKRPGVAGPSGISECDWADGAALLLNRRMLEQVGLFDERFFMYCEDADLALRGSQWGWRVGVVRDAVAFQAPGKRQRPGAYAYLMTRNGLAYRRRVGGARGVAAGIYGQIRVFMRVARVNARPGTSAEARSSARLEVLARAWGVADFLRGRWGPPPPGLPGLGDVDA